MEKAYHYVRFRWWKPIDLVELEDELKSQFNVERIDYPEGGLIDWHDHREELKVTADTLIAFLSSLRAVMSQKEATKFTALDLKLRERLLEIYSRNRPTPFPFMFSDEPEFEVEE